jgi:hypothetical protein
VKRVVASVAWGTRARRRTPEQNSTAPAARAPHASPEHPMQRHESVLYNLHCSLCNKPRASARRPRAQPARPSATRPSATQHGRSALPASPLRSHMAPRRSHRAAPPPPREPRPSQRGRFRPARRGTPLRTCPSWVSPQRHRSCRCRLRPCRRGSGTGTGFTSRQRSGCMEGSGVGVHRAGGLQVRGWRGGVGGPDIGPTDICREA